MSRIDFVIPHKFLSEDDAQTGDIVLSFLDSKPQKIVPICVPILRIIILTIASEGLYLMLNA